MEFMLLWCVAFSYMLGCGKAGVLLDLKMYTSGIMQVCRTMTMLLVSLFPKMQLPLDWLELCNVVEKVISGDFNYYLLSFTCVLGLKCVKVILETDVICLLAGIDQNEPKKA